MDDKETADTAQRDQVLKGLTDVAKSMAEYFKELRKGGMTRGEALQVVVAFQIALVKGGQR